MAEIFRRADRAGARTSRPTDTLNFVRAEIVHDQHLAGLQNWAQNFNQKAEKDFLAWGRFNGHGGNDATSTHPAQEGENPPIAFRDSLVGSLPAANLGSIMLGESS